VRTITATLGAYLSRNYCEASGSLCYIDDLDRIVISGVPVSGVTADELTSDGTSLFYRTGYILYKASIDMLTLNVLSYDSGYMGNYKTGYLAYQNEALALFAYSGYEDTDFDYPVNIAYEIMSYQSAIDYKRKMNGDTVSLQGRLAELWQRFAEMVKRDDYKPERIGNYYRRRSGNV